LGGFGVGGLGWGILFRGLGSGRIEVVFFGVKYEGLVVFKERGSFYFDLGVFVVWYEGNRISCGLI